MVWRLPPATLFSEWRYLYTGTCKKKKLGASEILTQSQFILCEIGRQISTNGNHAWRNLPVDPMLCKSSLKDKNVPNFDDGAKCFKNVLNKGNIYLNPLQEQQNTLLIGFFIKIFLN